jgi:serine/threonine protein kinase
MHDTRIMHRDLKPANIFVASTGALKIGDLGLGRIFSSGTMEAFTKVGTPLYMSPELLKGEGYDTRADI